MHKKSINQSESELESSRWSRCSKCERCSVSESEHDGVQRCHVHSMPGHTSAGKSSANKQRLTQAEIITTVVIALPPPALITSSTPFWNLTAELMAEVVVASNDVTAAWVCSWGSRAVREFQTDS